MLDSDIETNFVNTNLFLIYLANSTVKHGIFFMCGQRAVMLFMDNAQLYRHCIYFTIT